MEGGARHRNREADRLSIYIDISSFYKILIRLIICSFDMPSFDIWIEIYKYNTKLS
jgi:hypothetical protein